MFDLCLKIPKECEDEDDCSQHFLMVISLIFITTP